jgi:uncharacterized protein YggU (UPF0235/DUF167 family)
MMAGYTKRIKATGMYIHATVKAGMKRESLEKLKEGYFAVSVRQKAERNEANARVMELLADHFNVAVGKIRIVNGHRSPSKLILIQTDE